MSTAIDNDKELNRRPRLKEVCRHLQGMAEELGAEAKLPRLVELRDRLGVSMQTLSDAVREMEKRNVLHSVHGIGIYVTGKKQRQTTGNVGFLAPYNMRPDENVAYWGSVLAGMRNVARDRGYHLLLIDNASEFDDWDKIDGAILCDTHDPRDPQPGMAQPPQGFLGVAIFNKLGSFPHVTTDDFDGAYQLTRHLIGQGHQRIAFLGALHSGLYQLEQRKEGYLRALTEAGIQPDSRQMRELVRRPEWDELPDWYYRSGEHTLRCWMKGDWDELGCTALVVQNDNAARGAIQSLSANGFEVPRDVSVMGFDGLPAQHGALQLTTIGVPLFEVGERAMEMLLDYLHNPAKMPPNVTLPVTMIAGHTSAAIPVLASL